MSRSSGEQNAPPAARDSGLQRVQSGESVWQGLPRLAAKSVRRYSRAVSSGRVAEARRATGSKLDIGEFA
jgi:hypothetical protein